ncbi:BTAD domain-containing putative transcriptional regulator [Streptomyces sp. NPDC013457]|uniref:AfsR/SARP family transcriptional regulator n=1 Tax=Streptomyces sp. NPDC013457 TaxID=3364866 RepID=UPI0036F69471
MQFNLIGPFEIVTDDGQSCAPRAPKICQMLAVLALQPREAVATDTLIRELWGEEAPNNAIRTLQTHVYHARKMLEDILSPTAELLVTQAPGYRLDINDDEVDALVFEQFVRRAQWDLAQGSPERAADHLTRAQQLWRGPVLSNVPVKGVLTGRIAHLQELRIRALELRVETETRLGRSREFLPELRALVNDHPLHEWFHGQLIAALHRAGRRGEALQAYQSLYHILRSELGLEPSEELQRLQAEILHTTARTAVPLRPGKALAARSTAPLRGSAVAS